MTGAELAGLIRDDADAGTFRVRRSVMTSPEVLALERERVFDRCWLYVGHESELATPGAYRRRTVAGRPLFLIRGRDDRVRVFLNTCTHRGALVCRRDEGTAQVFQCFYHGWTFNDRGELVGVPDEAGYGEGFDRASLGLGTPPRVESYRGLTFVSFDPGIGPLEAYLAGAKEYIDLTLDSAEVLGGWTSHRSAPGTAGVGTIAYRPRRSRALSMLASSYVERSQPTTS